MCDLPSRDSKHVTADHQIVDVIEYFGVDMFFSVKTSRVSCHSRG